MHDTLLMAASVQHTRRLQVLCKVCLPAFFFATPTLGQPLSTPVYVTESIEAQQRLKDIAVLESAERWGDAAEGYQRLSNEFGDVLVRINEYHWRGLIDLVHERLGNWPSSAIEAYRRRLDDQAEREFQRLGSEPAFGSLQRFIDRWWWTTVGRQVAEKLADQAASQGHRELAEQLSLRLRRKVPLIVSATRSGDGKPLGKRLGEPLWDISIDDLLQSASWVDGQTECTAAEVHQAGSRVKTRYLPVLGGDFIYLQGASRLTAVRSLSGRLAWHYWPHEAYETVAENAGLWVPPIVIDGRLYALFDERQTDYRGVSRICERSLLVCLNAGSGKELWRCSLLSSELAQGNTRFISSPMIIGPYLYVLTMRLSGTGSKAIQLMHLRCEDGEKIRETHLFSTDDTSDRSLALGRMTAWGDSLFVQATPGVLACVSAATGRIRWLVHGAESMSIETVRLEAGAEPILMNISAEHGAIALHGIDDGREIRTICIDRLREGLYWTGLLDSRLIAFGTKKIAAIDLQKGEIIWEHKDHDVDWVGRPFLYSGGLFWSTPAGLHALTDDGRNRCRFDWPASCKPIHESLSILVDRGLFWILTAERLFCCATDDDAGTPMKILAIQANSDFEARLDVVALALRGLMDRRDVLSVVDTALSEAHEVDRRRKLFDLLLHMVNTPTIKLDLPSLDALMESVGKLADHPAQQVAWRMPFARRFAALGEASSALRLSQDILCDDRLREERLHDARTCCTAGRSAERLVAHIMKDHGREVYKVYEQAANRLLQQAVEIGSPALLEKVIVEYPNALAARQARLAWADLDLKSGHAIRAARRLLFLWHQIRQDIDSQTHAPSLLKKIAEVYQHGGLTNQSFYWLNRGQQIYPEEKELFRASMVTPRTAMAATFTGWRISSLWQRSCPHKAMILSPRFAIPNDRIEPLALLYASGNIEAMAQQTGEIKWTLPVGDKVPYCLGNYDDLLLLATRHELWALDCATGQRRWVWGRRPSQVDSPAVDPEIFTYINGFAVGELHMVIFMTDGCLFALRITDGEVLWKRKWDGIFHGASTLNDEYLVFTSIRSGRLLLTALEAWTGREVGLNEPTDIRQINWLDFTPSGVVVAGGSTVLAGYSGNLAQKLWELRGLGIIRRSTIAFGPTDLYLSYDGRYVARIRLKDGHELWRRPLVDTGEGMLLHILLNGDRLLVLTERSVTALDVIQGRLLWCSPLPADMLPESIRIVEGGLWVLGSSRERWALAGFRLQDGVPISLPDDLADFIASLDGFPEVVLNSRGTLILHKDNLYGWSWADAADTSTVVPLR